MREWEAGRDYGFADNFIQPWRYKLYSSSFILGYRVGKAEIDRLVEEAVYAEQNYGEFD